MATALLSFPFAQQAQIIRANQRDIYHVSSLRDQTETILRSWFGTRWLTRWNKEVELLVKIVYFGLTTGRAIQTLGEEYTDTWQQSIFTERTPSRLTRLVLILLPTLPSYLLSKYGSVPSSRSPQLALILRALPTTFEIVAETNLAIFYLQGAYYDVTKRILGIRHLSSIPEDPHTRPPSYSLLGILIAIRLLHRLITFIRTSARGAEAALAKGKQSVDDTRESFIDDRPISSLLTTVDLGGASTGSAQEDEFTILDVVSISPDLRAGRHCTLCLDERTETCATECGHLFCWSCILSWGREKAECPLCRQSLNLKRLLPIYNL